MTLAHRIIPVLQLMSGRMVKSRAFDNFRDVGTPASVAQVFYAQQADEIIFLNVDRDNRTVEPLLSVLADVADKLFIPLSVGGGIRTVDDATRIMAGGAEKVILNTEAYYRKSLITDLAKRFGSQSVCIGIDVRRIGDSFYDLYSDCGRQKHSEDVFSHVQECEDSGAGEIFIQSIDNDGVMGGYDIDLIELVQDCTQLPVVACGGAGNYKHVIQAFTETGVSGLAMSSLFNFSDSNPMRLKSALRNAGIKVRKQ